MEDLEIYAHYIGLTTVPQAWQKHATAVVSIHDQAMHFSKTQKVWIPVHFYGLDTYKDFKTYYQNALSTILKDKKLCRLFCLLHYIFFKCPPTN